MVITRSQSSQNRQVETENMDRSSDNESEASFPELLSRDQMVDLDSDDVLTRRQNSNSYNIDQRFNEINRQIGDLTNIVLTLTNQFASVNGEGNRLNPATTSTDGRSDNKFIRCSYGSFAFSTNGHNGTSFGLISKEKPCIVGSTYRIFQYLYIQ